MSTYIVCIITVCVYSKYDIIGTGPNNVGWCAHYHFTLTECVNEKYLVFNALLGHVPTMYSQIVCTLIVCIQSKYDIIGTGPNNVGSCAHYHFTLKECVNEEYLVFHTLLGHVPTMYSQNVCTLIVCVQSKYDIIGTGPNSACH